MSVFFYSSSMTLNIDLKASHKSTLLIWKSSHLRIYLSLASKVSWHWEILLEATLVFRRCIWFYSIPFVKGLKNLGMFKNVLPSNAPLVKSHFCFLYIYDRLTECWRWNSIVPITWAKYVAKNIFMPEMSNIGKIKKSNIIFYENGLLKIHIF